MDQDEARERTRKADTEVTWLESLAKSPSSTAAVFIFPTGGSLRLLPTKDQLGKFPRDRQKVPSLGFL
jgi:hypothetical protein